MEPMNPIRLTAWIPSQVEPEYIHGPGAPGIVVGRLGGDAFLIELRVPCGQLEGDAWYETIEVYEHEFEQMAVA